MAIYYSDVYTAISDGLTPKTLSNGLLDKVLFKQYTVEIPATATADELFYITPELPVGAVVDPTLSHVTCSADPGAGSLQLDIGLVTEDDLSTLIDVSAGGKVAFDGLANVTATSAKRYIIGKLETLVSDGSVGAVDLTFCIAYRGVAP
jgi:hypothetical protein